MIRSSVAICCKKIYFISEVLIEAQSFEELNTKSLTFLNSAEDGWYMREPTSFETNRLPKIAGNHIFHVWRSV